MAGGKADGYGLLSASHDLPRPTLAHRWAYERFVGPIPDGLVVRHTCDNRLCSNPSHLLVGTLSQNMQDMVDRKRHPRHQVTHCPQGHEYAGANLSIHRNGSRRCRACDRERHRRKYQEAK